jgi:hypothetical protein
VPVLNSTIFERKHAYFVHPLTFRHRVNKNIACKRNSSGDEKSAGELQTVKDLSGRF